MGALACGPKAPPPKPPEPAPVADAATEEAPPEPEAPPPKVPEDAFSIGTFNLDWAFDSIGDKRPKASLEHVAPDDAAWDWKRDRNVEVLVAEKLEVIPDPTPEEVGFLRSEVLARLRGDVQMLAL